MNGENAFVYYTSPNQVNVLTPPDLAPGLVQRRTVESKTQRALGCFMQVDFIRGSVRLSSSGSQIRTRPRPPISFFGKWSRDCNRLHK